MPRKLGSSNERIRTCNPCKGDKVVAVMENKVIVGYKNCPACNSKGGKHLGTI